MCQLFLDGALFLTEIYLFIYLLLEKTCGTRPAVKPPLSGTLHTERGQKHYIFDEQQTCFLCPSWWHFTFLILLFAFDNVN